MEIKGENGRNLVLNLNQPTKTELGRSQTSKTPDKTVSRRHIVLQLHPTKTLSFQVVGKNPIWVRRENSDKVEVFRRDEAGELVPGDGFCLSGKNPFWFSLKTVGDEDEDQECLAGCSDIDRVQEFGFLVKGHEFDSYPKKMIRDVKDWNWFLEEPSKDSDDDDGEDVGRKNSSGNRRGKRKKGKSDDRDDDDDWTGESEDDNEIVTKLRKVGKPKYCTRLKNGNKHSTALKSGNSPSRKSSAKLDEDDTEDESEDEDTLGGFIVDDVDEEMEENANISDEEEEEFVEDDDDEDE